MTNRELGHKFLLHLSTKRPGHYSNMLQVTYGGTPTVALYADDYDVICETIGELIQGLNS